MATIAAAAPRRPVRRRLAAAARAAATPLVPADFVSLLNPLWAEDLHGRIVAVHPETADAVTLVIRPGRGWTGHTPGQYVRVGVDVGGVRHWRAYSLTSLPDRPDGCVTVTPKALPGGVVSTHLVRRLRAGAVVRLSQAEGEFTLPARRPAALLFITAGSGITPVLGMLRQLAAEGRLDAGPHGGPPMPSAVLVHSAPTAADVVFGTELRAMARRLPGLRLHEQHTDTAGLLDAPGVTALVPDWRERQTFVCGPTAVLDAMEAHWAAARLAGSIHTERFRPRVVAVEGGGGRASFTRSGISTDVDAATPLLDAGERAGALLPSGCRMGICFGCVGTLTAGAVRDLRTGAVTTAPDPGGTTVQTCISAAAGDCSVDL